MFGNSRKVTKHINILSVEDNLKKELRDMLKRQGVDLDQDAKLRITFENYLRANHALRVVQER